MDVAQLVLGIGVSALVQMDRGELAHYRERGRVAAAVDLQGDRHGVVEFGLGRGEIAQRAVQTAEVAADGDPPRVAVAGLAAPPGARGLARGPRDAEAAE